MRKIDFQIEDFLTNCQIKQLSPKTIKSYSQTLLLFANWLENEGVTRAERIKIQHINGYISSLMNRGKYTAGNSTNSENRGDFNKRIFKDITRFSREAENGYNKYMELFNKGINLIFIDNPTLSTDYIKNLLNIAENQNIVTKTALESIVKLLLIVELDRSETERLTLTNRIRDGIKASDKVQGRKKGQLDKLTPEIVRAIKDYRTDRTITIQSLMNRFKLSRNTLKKYIAFSDENLSQILADKGKK